MSIVWVEPFGPNSEPVTCSVSKETAIATAKAVAKNNGKQYVSDHAALEDFKTIHWAWEVEDK